MRRSVNTYEEQACGNGFPGDSSTELSPRRTPASPITDFAYVVNTSKGDYLNLIIETKNVDGKRELRHEEHDKIKH
ncbi:TPA: hypothetical protein ACNEJL_004581, partial [Escherichia coli]